MNRLSLIPVWQIGAYLAAAGAAAYAARRWGLFVGIGVGLGLGLAGDVLLSPRGDVQALDPVQVPS